MKLDHLGVPYTRINSKWFKILNVRLETIKILEENIGSNISGISHSKIFFDISSQARETKENNKQMGLHQTKRLYKAKETINKMKRQPTEWENIFTNTSDKGLISKIYKVLTKLNTKTTNKPSHNLTKDLNRHFSKVDIQVANRHMKRYSMSLIEKRKLKPQ